MQEKIHWKANAANGTLPKLRGSDEDVQFQHSWPAAPPGATRYLASIYSSPLGAGDRLFSTTFRKKQNSSDPAPIDLAHESMAAEGLEVCAVVLSEHDPIPEDERSVLEQMPKASTSPDMSDPLSEFYYENLVAMKALSPDIIRGIPVYRALKVLQSIWFHGDVRQQFSFAQVVQEFDEFWSHSWKTRPFLKYACVLYLNNTMPAFLLGLLFAVVAAILFVAGILPAFVDFRKSVDCYWCTPAGIIGYYACLLLSARCKSVFLDVACIDQADPLRKAVGLVSLGAFLRSSKRMLVLWDESLTKDMWGFRVLGDPTSPKAILSGLVRVQASQTQTWLAVSGRDRWFIENPGERAKVSWVKRQKDETPKDYLDRVFAQSKGRGVAKGDTGLGLRLTEEEAKAQPPSIPLRTFKTWPVSQSWTQETLEHELTQFKFTDLGFIARHPCKGGVKFLYRGRAQDLHLAVIEHDQGSIQVVQQSQSLRRDITPSRAGRGAFTASALQATKPKPQPAPSSLPEPAPMDDGRSRPPAQHGPPKRQAVEAPASVPHTLLQGLTKKPNPGQGDCLFHALEQATGTNKLALRAAVCTHLRRHDAYYRAYWNCLAPTKEDTPMTDWAEYLDALAKPGAWTSLLEIHAAARHLDRAILLYSDIMPLQVCNRNAKNGPPLMLWYQAAHYELLEGDVPAGALVSAIDAPKSGCKGGAAPPSDESIASGHTCISAFSEPPLPRPSSMVEPREDSPARSSASGCTRLSAFSSTFEAESRLAARANMSTRPFAGTCPNAHATAMQQGLSTSAQPLNSLIQPRPPISQREGGSGADQPLFSAAQPFNSQTPHLAARDQPSPSFCCTASGPDPPSRSERGVWADQPLFCAAQPLHSLIKP